MTQIQKWTKFKIEPNSKMTQIQKWPRFKITQIKKWPKFKNNLFLLEIFLQIVFSKTDLITYETQITKTLIGSSSWKTI